MEEVQEAKWCGSWEAGFILVALYCCETWELIVADEAQLHQVEHRMITMCRVRLVDRLSTDVLHDKGVFW